MSDVFSGSAFLWTLAWQSTVCGVVGLSGSFAFRRHPSRAHRVLFLALIAAVVLPALSLTVRRFEWGIFVERPALYVYEPDDWEPVRNAPVMVAVATDPARERSAVAGTSVSSAVEPEREPISWWQVGVWGWMVCAAFLMLRLLIAMVGSFRLLRGARLVDGKKLHEALRAAAQRVGVTRPVRVFCSDRVRSPMIWCWGKTPALVMPRAYGAHGGEVDWVSVFSHELAHWKRRDHVTGLAAELATCAIPWQPFGWLAKSRLASLSEQACDDWAVAGGGSEADYAESLLDLIPQRQSAFAHSVVSSKKGLAKRVVRILKSGCGNPVRGLCGLCRLPSRGWDCDGGCVRSKEAAQRMGRAERAAEYKREEP